MKYRIAAIAAFLMSIILSTSMSSMTVPTASEADTPFVYTIVIHDVITNGTTEYVKRTIDTAGSDGAAAIVLLIDTPGGIVDSTLSILESIMASKVPVITYVAPQGAIAASAGSFILVSGHIAAMAPGTTCGAAMPVTFSLSEEGGTTETADDKTINFLAGHIRSIAEERGHNGNTAEQFVTENLTLTDDEALEAQVIDLSADSLEVLLNEIDGMVLTLHGSDHTLNTSGARIQPLEMTATESATGFLSNPTVSFLLVILGIYGLIIGFNAPHTYIPEAAGAIAFLVGLYGLGMFEINLFAVLMLVLGVLLLIAEAMTPTYGVLSIAGITSIVVGGFFLPREPLMPRDWLISFRSVAVGIGIGASILLVIILRGIIKTRHKKTVHGTTEFAGQTGTVIEALEDDYLIRINGELWHGYTDSSHVFKKNEKVTVLKRDGLKVIIQPIKKDM